ncbi:hypothetical protein HYR99_14260 [Candidatus Poribacteria bacterium]|nr:hypothetical protein [Candidatus Poribacteria bacterium]
MKVLTFFMFAIFLIVPSVAVDVAALTWDFEKPEQLKNDWKVINGKWEIEKGKLKGTLGPDYIGIVNVFEGSSEWTDYELEVETTVEEGMYTYWMVRVQPDPLSYYTVERHHVGGSVLWRRDAGKHSKIIDGPALPANHLETHVWKFVVKGDTITAYLDGKKLMEGTDKTYKKGTIGLGGHSFGSATGKNVILFDNVSVNGPGIPAAFSVSPGGKLALTWGEIKSK